MPSHQLFQFVFFQAQRAQQPTQVQPVTELEYDYSPSLDEVEIREANFVEWLESVDKAGF